MYFIIVYEPQIGKRLQIQQLSEEKYEEARDLRFRLEMQYRKENRDVEVVLLQAADEAALIHTHARYFEDIGRLMERRKTLQHIPA